MLMVLYWRRSRDERRHGLISANALAQGGNMGHGEMIAANTDRSNKPAGRDGQYERQQYPPQR
ncbi:hypothetical protein KCP78_25035 [Salmonella enterica subsp. enterica]|nr:hypothetical protein KCP78_25035 [Salmonella enterica subsp. enterica]